MISRASRGLFGLLILSLYGTRQASAQSAPSPEILINGRLSQRIVRDDEHVQFTLNIKNKADAKTRPGGFVQHLQLMSLPDGHTLDPNQSVCVLPLLPPHHESCQASQKFLAPGNV